MRGLAAALLCGCACLWAQAAEQAFTPPSIPSIEAPAALSAPALSAASAAPSLQRLAPALPTAAAPVQAQAKASPAAALEAATRPEGRATGPTSAGAAAFDGGRPLRIVEAAGESVPFIKTGGLADVVDAVSRGLAARGHDVTLILPRYSGLKLGDIELERHPVVLPIRMDWRVEPATLLVGRHQGVRVVLIENDRLFGRDGPYGSRDSNGNHSDYEDNDERFIFYSKAVLAASQALGLNPDVIHAHDWQAALIPALLKLQPEPALSGAKSVLSLHNLAFQGSFPFESLIKAGFKGEDFTYDKLHHYGRFNLLKAGVQFADRITTVSANYAREIKESAEHGMGLEGLLSHRSEHLSGIANGVDSALWSPATDAALPHQYGLDDAETGKSLNKTALQRRLGLPVDPEIPMLGVASRLSHQKGVDMIAEAIPELARLGAQIVVTGSGDRETVARFEELQRRYPENVRLHAAFDEDMARQIYAASDVLLMPSRFEPGGLSNKMAQIYGAVPVVSPTGGLVDSTDHGNDGFLMREASPAALIEAVAAALENRKDGALWSRTRRNAMTRDNSWDGSLRDYEKLFRGLIGS